MNSTNKGPLIVLIFIVVIAIVGVGGYVAWKYLLGGGTPTPTNGQVNLSFLSLWDNADVYQPLIDQYQKDHPNVHITYTKKSFANLDNLTYKGVYQSDIEERLANGTVDIVRVHQTWIPKLLPELAPAPTDVLSGTDAKNIYYPAIYEAITTSNDLVYGAPQSIDGLVLIYNKQLFAQAGITDPHTATKDWDVTLTTAKKLTKANANGTLSVAGINMGSMVNVESSPETLLLMLTQSNVPIVSIDQTTGKVTPSFATSDGVAAVNRFYEFAAKGVWSSRMADDVQSFSQGRLAMMIAPSWRVIDILAMNSNLQVGTLPLPTLPGANANVPQYLASYWIDVVAKKSPHSREAWEFLKWLGEPAQLRTLYQNETKDRLFGNPYPRTDMASEQAGAPYIGAVITMAPKMKTWPLYDYGIWEQTLRNDLLDFDDKGGVTQSDLQKIQTDLSNLTLK